jgi:hypothetical protein
MILTPQEIHPQIVLPGVDDRAVAARVSSLVCWVSALWFFLSPWTFFGVSERPSGWNAWIVGGLMVVISMFRLAAPRESTPFGFVNAVLGLWTICSPWIFSYTNEGGHTANTISVGACIVGFSLMSLVPSRALRHERNLSCDNSD